MSEDPLMPVAMSNRLRKWARSRHHRTDAKCPVCLALDVADQLDRLEEIYLEVDDG